MLESCIGHVSGEQIRPSPRVHRVILYVYFFVNMMLLAQEEVLVSSFRRMLVMSTSTPKKSSKSGSNKFTTTSSSSSSSSVPRGRSKSSENTDFVDFRGKKLGMDGVQNIIDQHKVNKLRKGEIQPKDFVPKYATHKADNSFDDQLTSLNKKSNEMLADLKHVYLKLRVLTEV